MTNKVLTGIGIIVAVVLFGIVGRMDYEDELKSQAHYCEMVREGAWPDFKKIFEESCTFDEKRVDDE
ncbi:MAG: hypothetical protein CMH23_07135 [Methylophaga sp.]|uniref:hypothetical protein n=1 Tax=Methylophaga sp. TaxID=2024840 RepID=UPI000C98F1DE|nr:hypothetical protein [Methylophaga sp.]MBN46231.1 hypothetical protein [Methylophaga sp.]QDP56568.1 MAG: hypothetical protein GOVbin2380_3 [Prokaryotic dsDNA virus sp.]|tara:strand:- start:31303 stop:31503 length:201 start_codon:yes stop_codon:yes gene_type:complete